MHENAAICAGDWLAKARRFLEESTKDPARASDGFSFAAESAPGLEIQVLLAYVLGRPRAWLIAHQETELTPQQQERAGSLLQDLARGVPLPYLTGQQAFYGLDFTVSPAVLIPRPETELLVERALGWLSSHPNRRAAADVGTGSGCIAVTLAKHIADLRILAVDRSRDALEVARQNATRHAVSDQIHFLQADLLNCIHDPLDLVCANLPYIPQAGLAGLPVARYEPRMALDGGADGLALIRALLADAPRWLAPGGCLLLEMQYDQGDAITELANQFLPGAQAQVLSDLAGLPRLVQINRI